jgi:small subunit ribosomal protein S16
MLAIRLFRTGKKNQPMFKIVVTDRKRSSKRGRFVEEVGFYNPVSKEKNLKKERIKYWISVGAKPSDTIFNMLISEKVIEGKKIDLHKKSKKEAPAQEAVKPAQPAAAEPVVEKQSEPIVEKQPEPVENKSAEQPVQPEPPAEPPAEAPQQ